MRMSIAINHEFIVYHTFFVIWCFYEILYNVKQIMRKDTQTTICVTDNQWRWFLAQQFA